MDDMNSRSIPLAFSEGVEEIILGRLGPKAIGDYDLDTRTIRVSSGNGRTYVMRKTLIHEIGHHLSMTVEQLYLKPSLIKEKKTAWRFLGKEARQNVDEYISLGFETFYFGTPFQRSAMRELNPKLWNVISHLHKKYKDL